MNKEFLNIAVIGHTQHGKTTFVEALKKAAGSRYIIQEAPANNISNYLDAVIVVVSATDGILYETREQVEAAKIAGVKDFIVFINKTDLVEDVEIIDLVEFETHTLIDESNVESAVFRGSALKGRVVSEVLSYIVKRKKK